MGYADAADASVQLLPETADRPRPKQESPPASHQSYLAVKAVAEALIACLSFIIALPIIVIAAVVVKLTSRGPALYSQIRVGRNGCPFRIYKIRTMEHNCEAKTGPCWSAPGDPRVTLVGRVLRGSHLDELPQLINVMRGQMSLIGPRPERPEFLPVLEDAIPSYRRRLAVRPGVTGFAQVQLPADTDLASVRRKLQYDLYYIQHASVWLDLRILAATAFYVAGIPRDVTRRVCLLPGLTTVEGAVQPAVAPVTGFQSLRLKVATPR